MVRTGSNHLTAFFQTPLKDMRHHCRIRRSGSDMAQMCPRSSGLRLANNPHQILASGLDTPLKDKHPARCVRDQSARGNSRDQGQLFRIRCGHSTGQGRCARRPGSARSAPASRGSGPSGRSRWWGVPQRILDGPGGLRKVWPQCKSPLIVRVVHWNHGGRGRWWPQCHVVGWIG